MNEATPRPLACPSERHAADNPCAVDCAVCRDECWPDIVKAVNAHDALVAALEQTHEYIKRPDIDDDAHTLGVVADLITAALDQVK